MVSKVIHALIAIAVAVLLVFLIFWVLGALGIAFPEQLRTIIMVIVALCVLLYLWRTFSTDIRSRL